LDPPPNIVVFIADDQGYGDLGCYGNTAIKTPHIDRLAREGMRLDRAFLTISSCSPSRASILTGRYPHNTGAEDLHQPLPDDQKTIGQYLKLAGYYCAAAGKWHLGDSERQHWHQIIECSADITAESAVDLVDNAPVDSPFFFWIASKDPHRPYQLNTIAPPHRPADVRVPPYLPDHPNIRKEIALYYDEISRFDTCVGAVRAALEKSGRLENTVIVYLSDNGMPFPRAKTTLYDAGIRAPLIVRWPGKVPANSIQNSLFSVVDLAPTLLSIADVEQDTMQGRDASAMWLDPRATGRDAVYAEANWHDFEKFTRCVRTDNFKLIRNYYWDVPLWNSVDSINSITWTGLTEMKRAGKLTPAQSFLFRETRPYEELYDLRVDPHELNDVADDPVYSEDLAKLRTKLDNWRVDTADRMPAKRRLDGWTRDGNPLPHNQPWYDRWLKQGKKNQFETY
jgi:arylsulfatase A-like enzyme